jgi:hypothetical protein
MVAVYPSAIKTFSYRQDYTELVQAADVNVTYDELRAVQSTLGVNPQNDTIDNVVNKWSSVSARIGAVRAGVSKPFVNVSANNTSIPYNELYNIQWKSKTWDTHGIWDGSQNLVCPRDGVYTFSIYIRWHSDNHPDDNQQTPFNRNGKLEIYLSPVNGSANFVNQAGAFPLGWQKATHQSASITLPWAKGQALTMQAYQDCLTSSIVSSAFCSIVYHRDPPTANNL